MRRPTASEIVLYAAALVAIGWIGWRGLRDEQREVAPAGDARPGVTTRGVRVERPVARVVVHVVGAVRRPGVYSLREGKRVRDAVARAGGPAAGADLEALNLAAKVADAQQVVVPSMAAPGADPGTGGAGPEQPVSLSTATAEQLDQLDGVGPETARKIIEYRSAHGGFRSIDELGDVPGIGPKRLETLSGQLQP